MQLLPITLTVRLVKPDITLILLQKTFVLHVIPKLSLKKTIVEEKLVQMPRNIILCMEKILVVLHVSYSINVPLVLTDIT